MRYTPEELQRKVQEVAGKYAGLPQENAAIKPSYLRSQIAMALNTAMNDPERHAVLAFLTGESSTKKMPVPMLRALHRWLYPECAGGLEKPEYVDKKYVCSDTSIEEAVHILDLIKKGEL